MPWIKWLNCNNKHDSWDKFCMCCFESWLNCNNWPGSSKFYVGCNWSLLPLCIGISSRSCKKLKHFQRYNSIFYFSVFQLVLVLGQWHAVLYHQPPHLHSIVSLAPSGSVHSWLVSACYTFDSRNHCQSEQISPQYWIIRDECWKEVQRISAKPLLSLILCALSDQWTSYFHW